MKKLLIIAMIFSFAIVGSTENTFAAPVPIKEKAKAIYKEPVSMQKLPKFAQQYLKENFPIRQVKEVSKVDNGNAAYEVAINLEGKTAILQFDAKGDVVKEVVKK